MGKKLMAAPMSTAVYGALARSRLLQEVKRAFRDATGLSLRLVSGNEEHLRPTRGKEGNAFCELMAGSAGSCAACRAVQQELQQRLRRKLVPEELCCFAGMLELAVPVVVGGQHAATLLGGQVFGRKPGRWQFNRVARQMREWGLRAPLRQIRRAYFQTPVVPGKRLRGAVRLLTILAGQLAESTNRCLLGAQRHEPRSVTEAKAFVRAHAAERVTLRQTAAHVHVSRHYFCKLFKQSTGLTFTEFVARVRVENAKGFLADQRLRVSDVADRAGFRSISQFNRAFRRHAGASPTEFRAALWAAGETR